MIIWSIVPAIWIEIMSIFSQINDTNYLHVVYNFNLF